MTNVTCESIDCIYNIYGICQKEELFIKNITMTTSNCNNISYTEHVCWNYLDDL